MRRLIPQVRKRAYWLAIQKQKLRVAERGKECRQEHAQTRAGEAVLGAARRKATNAKEGEND